MLVLGAILLGVSWGHISLVISTLRPFGVWAYPESSQISCPIACAVQVTRTIYPLTQKDSSWWHFLSGLADPPQTFLNLGKPREGVSGLGVGSGNLDTLRAEVSF